MIKIYNEDCLKTMARIPDNYIDLTVTSPPYDNLRTYNGELQWNETICKAIIKCLFRVTKKGGVVVWIVGDATIKGSETGTSFNQALYFKECGFNLHDTMIYAKKNYVPLTHNRYEQQFEYMFIWSKGKPNIFNPIMIECKTKGRETVGRTFYQTNDNDAPTKAHKKDKVKTHKQAGNIWEIATNTGAKGHPAQFPEQLAHDHIISWSNEEDLIYDPFTGSGTTAKMAKILKRNFIGSEKVKKYCEIAIERLKNETSHPTA